jgi:FkbM family methyltransferase
LNRFVRVEPDDHHDLSYGRWPEFAIDMQIRLVTINPKPIWMYQSRNTQAMLKYQAESPMETNERKIFRSVLKNVPESFVMDIGSNDGFYALLSASYGHRVAAFEPQPNCAALLYMSVAFNDFKHPPKVFQNVASSKPRDFKMPRFAPCLGTKSFDTDADSEKFDVIGSIDPAKVMEANGNRSVLIHIDVEGAEIDVLRDLGDYIRRGQVENVIFESVPIRWSKFGVSIEDGLDTLRDLFRGMICREVVSMRQLFGDFDWIEGDIWCTRRDVPLDQVDSRTLPLKWGTRVNHM